MRLFIAVNFPEPLKRALAGLSAELAAMSLPVRWTPASNFHLTLRWLGERNVAAREAVERILPAIAAGTEAFDVGFGTVGAFPSLRHPRVIWISAEAGPRLRVLRDELERRLADAGFDRDRRSYRPHVTLGRARRDAAPGAFRRFATAREHLTIDAAIPVRSIDLMRSRLGPGGVRYERLSRANLRARTLQAPDSRT